MPSPLTIPVLERSIDLLSAIAESPKGLSAKELNLQLGIPQATCYRILRTLVQKSLLQEQPNGIYLPAYGLARLAGVWSGLENRLQELKPLLEDLAYQSGLSAKISIKEGTSAVVVMRAEARKANSITSPVGSKMPLTEAGSAGIMLMASANSAELSLIQREVPVEHWKEIARAVASARTEKMARSYGTHHSSIYAVSIPLSLGRPCALTLVGWPEAFTGKQKKKIETLLSRCRELW